MINGIRKWLIRLLGGRVVPLLKNGGEIRFREQLVHFSADEMREFIIATWNDAGDKNWFMHFYVTERENERLKRILASTYHNDKELNRALHMADLETKNRRLKREIREMQEAAERNNATAYATGLIVNCTGCEAGKPFNGEELTEDRVQTVEMLAKRLRAWFTNHQWRLKREHGN